MQRGDNAHLVTREVVREVDHESGDMDGACTISCVQPSREMSEELPLQPEGAMRPASVRQDAVDSVSRSPHLVCPLAVTLHVYDVTMNSNMALLNRLLKPLGSGAFHCGVEVLGNEWSFTDILDPVRRLGTGVFQCIPQQCPGHVYSESVSMGEAYTSEIELFKMVRHLERQWPCRSYDAFTHNCCHFVNDFCLRFGVGPIPAWILHLAAVGAATEDVTDTTCCRMMSTQVSASLCCQTSGTFEHNPGEVNSMPALTQGPDLKKRARHLTPRSDMWTVVESLDDEKPRRTTLQQRWWKQPPPSEFDRTTIKIISLDPDSRDRATF